MGRRTLDGTDLAALREAYPEQRQRAIDIADRMLPEGTPAVAELDGNSLRWCGDRHARSGGHVPQASAYRWGTGSVEPADRITTE